MSRPLGWPNQRFQPTAYRARSRIEITSLRVLEGRLPPRALGLVIEWASQHQEALMRDWLLARDEKPPEKIAPLN